MPVKGQLLTNPHTGDSYEFLETAKDTQGKSVTIKFTLHSKGKLVPAHIHLLQDETFTVIAGKLTCLSDGVKKIIPAGEAITLSKGKPHNHYNMEDTPLVMLHTVTPALDFDLFIENLIGLTIDGKSKQGKPKFFQQMATFKYLDSKARLANVSMGFQNFLIATMAPVGRLLGYRALYKKYCGVEK